MYQVNYNTTALIFDDSVTVSITVSDKVTVEHNAPVALHIDDVIATCPLTLPDLPWDRVKAVDPIDSFSGDWVAISKWQIEL